jgi:TetR/AcrR family transcriptional regulator, transcriptional repressor for nem operon
MSRPRSYDEDAVLGDAMHLFRRRGFHAVSVRDLEDATGLKSGSIYNSFGDKAGLFEAAFAHYNRAILLRRIDRYAPPAAGLWGLRDLFLSPLREPGGESYGCLITNSAVEFGGEEGSHPYVAEGLRILSETFADRLSAAHQARSLPGRVTSTVTAAKLLALYQGVLVLVRAGYDKAVLERLITAEFDDLGGAS